MQAVLSCPQCQRVLAQTDGGFSCPGCQRLYPIIDGIPSFVGEGGSEDAFDPGFFALLEHAEAHHFWFIGRREIILDALKRHVPDLSGKRMLEIGCGNGNILRYLQNRTELQLTGCDLFMEGLQFCRNQVDIPLYQIDATLLPFHNCFDIIGIFDVLEHIEPALLDNVLDDLQRVTADVGVFTVHTGRAAKVLPDGRNAHLIQQPPAWWLPKFLERFELANFNRVVMGFMVVVERKRG